MNNFEIECTTQVILREINELKLTQAEVAKTCALAIRANMNETDWKAICAAIVSRWSPSARERVLTMAWKIVEGTK